MKDCVGPTHNQACSGNIHCQKRLCGVPVLGEGNSHQSWCFMHMSAGRDKDNDFEYLPLHPKQQLIFPVINANWKGTVGL